ncbi:MAG: Calx-beta domain-containing protein [Bdellovibrionota bacterium]
MAYFLHSRYVSILFAILYLWGCGNEYSFTNGARLPTTSQNIQISLHYPEHYLANNNGIIIRVSNVLPKQMVRLYTSARCESSSMINERNSYQNEVVDFDVTLIEDGAYTYYTQVENQNGSISDCLGPAYYLLDQTPPKFVDNSSFGSAIQLSTNESVNDIYIYSEGSCSSQVGQLVASSNGSGNDYLYAPTLTSNGVYAFWAQTTDIAMNLSACFGPLLYVYTNATPSLSISAPSSLDINTGIVSYSVTYSNTTSVNLTTGDITVNTTGTPIYSVPVNNGTTTTPTIQINITGGNGSIDSIDIADGTASNMFDIAFGDSESTPVNIDNIAPTATIAAPSTTNIATGNVDYGVNFIGADTINVTPADITVNTSGTVSYTVNILNPTTSNPTIRLTITGGDGTIDSVVLAAATASDNAGNTDIGNSNSTTVTVQNNMPVVTFTTSTQTSGIETGTMIITATIPSAYFFDVTVPFTINASSTANNPNDYTISSSPLTITAGNTSADITITIATDTLHENNETIIIDMGTPTNATQGAIVTHTATISDDDTAPGVTLTVDNTNIAEAAGTATFTASLDAVSGLDVTVNLALTGTATNSGTDYTLTTTSIVIPAGSTTGSTIVTAVQDLLDENDETVIIDIASVTNGIETGLQQQTTNIIDDDATPTVTFSSSGQTSINETGTFTVTAELSAISGLDVTAPFTVTGSANNPADYTITASPVTIVAGNISVDITITLVDDTLGEPSETVILTLDPPTNATLGATTVHTLTIIDDDDVDIETTMTGPATEDEGGTISYLITATNHGPQNATNLTISNSCPTGTTFSSATASGATNYVAPNWAIGTLVNANSETLTLSCTVDAGQGGSIITNTIISGDIAVDQNETNTANDGSSLSTTINNATDLTTSKTAPASADEGSDIVYSIVITNNGPAQAQNLSLTDSCPTGTTFNAGGTSATQGTYSAPTWTVGTLNSAASATLTLACTVNAGQSGNTITNTIVSGDLSMNQTESNTGNDGSSASTIINNATDLATNKTAPASILEGSDIVYTITIINNGPAQAQSVSLSDSCPTGTTFNVGGTSATQGTYSAPTWTVGTLNSATNATLTLACTVNAGQSGNTITNTIVSGDLSMNQTESNTGNDGSSASTIVQEDIDLSMTKSGPTTGEVGVDLIYTITITNLGPIGATNVAVNDPCPTGTTHNAAGTSATLGSYTAPTWSIGALSNGGNAVLTLACTVNTGEESNTITNTLTDTDLTQDQYDTNNGNESASVSSLVASSSGGGSYSGTSFWAVFPRNYNGILLPCYSGDCIITVQGDPGVDVTIDGATTTIGASGQFTQVMSALTDVAPYNGVSTTAPFTITATAAISVFMGNALDQTSAGGSMLIPNNSLGKVYYALGYENSVVNNNPVRDIRSQIHVIATVDNTTVNIGGSTQLLDEGESFSVSQVNTIGFQYDSTGVMITADQPIVAYSAETCLDTGGGACDMAMTQLHPADLSADTEFFFGGFAVQSEEFKCVATANSASVTVNGVFDNIYNQGDEINFTPDTVLHVQSTQPLMCGVFAIGSGNTDPALAQVPGINRGMTGVSFPVPTPFLAGDVVVMMLTADTGTFLYDSATVGGWTTFASDPSYSYTIISLTSGPHTFEANSKFVPIMLTQPRTHASYAASIGGIW